MVHRLGAHPLLFGLTAGMPTLLLLREWDAQRDELGKAFGTGRRTKHRPPTPEGKTNFEKFVEARRCSVEHRFVPAFSSAFVLLASLWIYWRLLEVKHAASRKRYFTEGTLKLHIPLRAAGISAQLTRINAFCELPEKIFRRSSGLEGAGIQYLILVLNFCYIHLITLITS